HVIARCEFLLDEVPSLYRNCPLSQLSASKVALPASADTGSVGSRACSVEPHRTRPQNILPMSSERGRVQEAGQHVGGKSCDVVVEVVPREAPCPTDGRHAEDGTSLRCLEEGQV